MFLQLTLVLTAPQSHTSSSAFGQEPPSPQTAPPEDLSCEKPDHVKQDQYPSRIYKNGVVGGNDRRALQRQMQLPVSLQAFFFLTLNIQTPYLFLPLNLQPNSSLFMPL